MDHDHIAATNHYLSPAMAPLNEATAGPALEESQARLARIDDFLGSSDLATVEALTACAAIDSGPGCVCRQADTGPVTLAGAIIDPAAATMWLTGRPTAEGQWARLTFDP